MRTLVLFLLSFAAAATALSADRPNVLFIAVDDLRPQTASYGQEFMRTPNLDRLAKAGVLFERAYCMVPTCGASRAALMTSLRPKRDRFVNHLTWAERDAPGVVTLNRHFKDHGYTTLSLGKVFHHAADSAEGWSEPAWRPRGIEYQDREATESAIANNKQRYPGKRDHRGPAVEAFEAPDDAYPDGRTAAEAMRRLRDLSAKPDQPFFLAVGFLKPHLPFVAPKRFWDLYDREKIAVPENYARPPKDAPAGAVHQSGELRVYAGIPPTGALDEETARELIHGYYACVSFVDAQIGKLLDELERLNLARNTIVVLWGDHGWQLGDHGMWNKHSCFETSMHAPLWVAAPMRTDVAPGTRVAALTEFIDIYPSLCELAGLPIPEHVQGTSFLPQMRDPSQSGKPYAVGRFGPGDTIRSDDARFTQYSTASGEVTGTMLYDHRVDPRENVNIAAERPSQAKALQDALREIALPPAR